MPHGWTARPNSSRREPLTFHEERYGTEPRALFHLRFVKDHGVRPHFTVVADANRRRLQYAILKEMRLQDAIVVQSGAIADFDKVELQASKISWRTAPDECRGSSVTVAISGKLYALMFRIQNPWRIQT